MSEQATGIDPARGEDRTAVSWWTARAGGGLELADILGRPARPFLKEYEDALKQARRGEQG